MPPFPPNSNDRRPGQRPPMEPPFSQRPGRPEGPASNERPPVVFPGQMPMGPPPERPPMKPVPMTAGARAVNPASIRNCMRRFTYVWLRNGQEFWIFPIQIWGNTIGAFRWDRRFGWSYTGISLNRIDMFTCSA